MNPLGRLIPFTGDKRRQGILLLAVVAAIGIGYRNLYLPQAEKFRKLNKEQKALQVQIKTAKEALPDLEKERQQQEEEAELVDSLRRQLRSLEGQLPTTGGLSLLLKELVRQGEGLSITFDSIKQTLKEDPEKPEVTVELKLKASFENLLNYLNRVEQLSPFLRTERLSVSETKVGSRTSQEAEIVLVTPLRISLSPEGLKISEKLPTERIALSRSPFSLRPRGKEEEAKRKEIQVDGIIWREGQSTAIVNGEVVRIGDKVSDFQVKDILPNRVVLADGEESFTVELTR